MANLDTGNYLTYLETQDNLKETLKKGTHQCPSCLWNKEFEQVEIKNPRGLLATCPQCKESTLGISNIFLGKGNAKELEEYDVVHAEWLVDIV